MCVCKAELAEQSTGPAAFGLGREHQLLMLHAVVHAVAVVASNRAPAQACDSGDDQPAVLDAQRRAGARVVIKGLALDRKFLDGRFRTQDATECLASYVLHRSACGELTPRLCQIRAQTRCSRDVLAGQRRAVRDL